MSDYYKIGILFAGQEIQLEYGFASSIQKEFNRAEDGTILTEKHVITIRGSFSADGQDPSSRYSNLLQKSIEYADFKGLSLVDRLVSLQAGPLLVARMRLNGSNQYEVQEALFTYNYAQLISSSVSEPPEDTAGIHFQELTLTFESITPPTDNIAVRYRLKAASEQFEIKKEEDRLSYFVIDFDSNGNFKGLKDDPYFSYTITHTLSAQGLSVFYNSTSTDYNDSQKMAVPSPTGSMNNQKYEAFYEAFKYINDKKKDSLIGTSINLDIHGRKFIGANSFVPVGWEAIVTEAPTEDGRITVDTFGKNKNITPTAGTEIPITSGIVSQLLWNATSGSLHASGGYGSGNYGEYNIIRSSTVDMIAGSYSLTTSYFYSRNPATIEVNGVYEKGEDGNDTVRVEGTITGLDSKGVNSDTQNKYKNARTMFENVCKRGPNENLITSQNRFPDLTKVTDNIGSGLTNTSTQAYEVEKGTGIILSVPYSGVTIPATGNTLLRPWGIGTNVYYFADRVFNDNTYTPFYNTNMVLDVRPQTTSVTENKVGGTINFSASYKPIPRTLRDIKIRIPDCLSVTLNIQDDNKYHQFAAVSTSAVVNSLSTKGFQVQHVVPVMILGKSTGPIIQNMYTTKEAKKTVQLEAMLDVAQRYPESDAVNSGIAIALEYYPKNTVNYYLTELQETWDWPNGKLTVNLGWTYTR
jgi:hypothetical protein